MKLKKAEDFILAKAFELFVSQGYKSTSIEEIARQANVSKGLVYYYFNTKINILRKIIDIVGIIDTKIDFAEFDRMSIDEIYNYIFKLYYENLFAIETITQQPWIKVQRFYFEAMNILPEFYEKVRQRYESLVSYLKERLELEYRFSEDEALLRASMFIASIEGLMNFFMFFPHDYYPKLMKTQKNFFTCHLYPGTADKID